MVVRIKEEEKWGISIIKQNQLSHYPDPECKEAKKEISQYYRSSRNIAV